MSKKPPYANEATKRIALTLSGVVGIAEALMEAGRFRGSEDAMESIKVFHEAAQKALDAVMDGLDEDQIKGILRYGDLCEFTLVPKSSPVCSKGFFIFDPEDVKALMKNPLSQCNFCELSGDEAKRCPMRKMMLKTGVVELGDGDKLYGDCPYQC